MTPAEISSSSLRKLDARDDQLIALLLAAHRFQHWSVRAQMDRANALRDEIVWIDAEISRRSK
jgi:hypothetical protein